MSHSVMLAEQGELNFSTAQRVRHLKAEEQDFEWYPSSEHIIDVVRRDLVESKFLESYNRESSLLDIGAGDGRVLSALNMPLEDRRGEMSPPFYNLYAIEKSLVHCSQLDKKVLVIGTDFNQQTLVDKPVGVIFSNPPYSAFEQWATRIITEANAEVCYLVLPQRWSGSRDIEIAIKLREAEAEVIGTFDFQNDCDRETRYSVPVDIIRVNLGYKNHHQCKVDPFKAFFDANFDLDLAESDYSAKFRGPSDSTQQKLNELVPGGDMVKAMQSLYDHQMAKLMGTYSALAEIDPDLLRELEVSKSSVLESLKLKIKSLKSLFWKELFAKFDALTSRLTSSNRKALLELLERHVSVDFTAENAYAIAQWAIKHADALQDDQFKDFYLSMSQAANVVNYISNQRTFKYDRWRYRELLKNGQISHFRLDYRCVMENVGGIVNGYDYNSYYNQCGLSCRAIEFITDLVTIAGNLGFDTRGTPKAYEFKWASNKAHDFRYIQSNGSIEVLFTVRAFLNGNLHIKMNPKLALKLNVVAGKLFGWVRSAEEAAAEMEVPASHVVEVTEMFGHSLSLTHNYQNLLMAA